MQCRCAVQMIKTAAARPGDRVNAIMANLRQSGLLSDPTAPGFGMQIQSQMLPASPQTTPDDEFDYEA